MFLGRRSTAEQRKNGVIRGQFLILTHEAGMARKLRVQDPGAIYHVMNRGDRREPICQDDADRRRFVETLAEAGGDHDDSRLDRGAPGDGNSRSSQPPAVSTERVWREVVIIKN